ncbi:MAG: glycosyltransferase family 1 protein [Acidimicrobiales bacterium]
MAHARSGQRLGKTCSRRCDPQRKTLVDPDVTVRLALVTLAVPEPMGQQAYERELAARAPGELGSDWRVDRVEVRTLRSPLPGTARVPSRLLTAGPATVRRATGRLLYRGHDLVHRFDLRLPPAPAPEVLTIHDVVPWRFPDEAMPPSDAASSARRAEVVVCPSQFSADEVATELGVRAPVAIPNGVDRAFFDPAPFSETELARHGIHPPFVLHAGGCSRRKNLEGLAAAWPLVRSRRPDATLVLVGPRDVRRDQLFAPLPGTVRTGRLDAGSVPRLMAAATSVVVPSLYEGFGLPALEAMAAGVPVVAARRSALPEVCGDAALLVEPDADALAEGLVTVLAAEFDTGAATERGRRRAAGFTWEASAAAHAALWREKAH